MQSSQSNLNSQEDDIEVLSYGQEKDDQAQEEVTAEGEDNEIEDPELRPRSMSVETMVVKMNINQRRINPQVVKSLEDLSVQLGDTVKVNMIRKAVNEMLIPFAKKQAVIQDEQKRLKTNYVNFGRAQDMTKGDIKHAQSRLGEVIDIRRQIMEIEKLVNKCERTVTRGLIEMRDFNRDLTQKVDSKQRDMDHFRTQLDGSSDRLKAIQKAMDLTRKKNDESLKRLEFQTKKEMVELTEHITGYQIRIDEFAFKYGETKKSLEKEIVAVVNQLQAHTKQEMKKFEPALSSLNDVKLLKHKMKTYEPKLELLMNNQMQAEHVGIYLERTLPYQIHFSICEALRETTGLQFQSKLHQFQLSKLDEIQDFNQNCVGHKTNVGNLNERLKEYARHFTKERRGISAFIFGRDYAPWIEYDEHSLVDKSCQRSLDQENTKQAADRVNMDKLKRLLKRIEFHTAEEEQAMGKCIQQLEDYQIAQLHNWIYRLRIENEEYDSIILDFEMPKAKEDEEPRQEVVNVRAPPPKAQASMKSLSQMMAEKKVQLPDPAIKSPVKSNGGIQKQDMMAMLKQQMQNKFVQQRDPAQAPAKNYGAQQADDAAQEATNKVEEIERKLKRAIKVGQGKKGGPHVCSVSSELVQSMIEAALLKSQADASNTPAGSGEMFIVPTSQTLKQMKVKTKSMKAFDLNQKKEMAKLKMAIKELRDMIPESVIEFNQRCKQGEDVDLKDIVEKIEQKEDENMMTGIRERFTKETILFEMNDHEKKAQEDEHQEKLANDPSYRANLLKNGSEKMKNGCAKIKDAVEVAKKIEIQKKALAEARPNFADDEDHSYVKCGLKYSQTKYIQKMLDKNIDWLRLFIKVNIESKMVDMKKQQQKTFEDLQGYTQKNVKMLKKKSDQNYVKVEEAIDNCHSLKRSIEELNQKFKEDSQELIRFKQRLLSDIQVNNEKTERQLNNFQTTFNLFTKESDINKEVLSGLLEVDMINSLIQTQDFEDKRHLNLLGAEKNSTLIGSVGEKYRSDDTKKIKKSETLNPPKVYKVEKDQLMHEGSYSASNTLKQIQIACLSYKQTPIDYRGMKITGDELLLMKEQLLIKCQTLNESMQKVPKITPAYSVKKSEKQISIRIPSPKETTMSPAEKKAGDSILINDDQSVGENDNISIEFDMRQLKPSLGNLIEGARTGGHSTKENLNLTTATKFEDSRKQKIEKINMTQLKNQFNISSIFKNHYKKQDKSVEPPKKQQIAAKQTEPRKFLKSRSKMDGPRNKGNGTVDLKTHHLHNRSNTQAILMDIAQQDVVQQWVEKDVKYAPWKNYTTYSSATDFDKKILIRKPTPPKRDVDSQCPGTVRSDSKKHGPESRLNGIQFGDKSAFYYKKSDHDNQTIEYNQIKSMLEQFESAGGISMRVRASEQQKTEENQREKGVYPHQKLLQDLQSQGIISKQKAKAITPSQRAMMPEFKRSKTPGTHNFRRQQMKALAGTDLQDVVTQQTTEHGPDQNTQERSLLESSKDLTSRNVHQNAFYSQSLMTDKTPTNNELNDDYRSRSQMQNYIQETLVTQRNEKQNMSQMSHIQGLNVAVSLVSPSPPHADNYASGGIRQVRQDYVQASKKRQILAKGTSLAKKQFQNPSGKKALESEQSMVTLESRRLEADVDTTFKES